MEFRKEYLEKLLEGQLRVQKESPYPDMKLILDEEIHEIQRIWRVEQGDWQNSAYQIYEKVIGLKLESVKEDMGAIPTLPCLSIRIRSTTPLPLFV